MIAPGLNYGSASLMKVTTASILHYTFLTALQSFCLSITGRNQGRCVYVYYRDLQESTWTRTLWTLPRTTCASSDRLYMHHQNACPFLETKSLLLFLSERSPPAAMADATATDDGKVSKRWVSFDIAFQIMLTQVLFNISPPPRICSRLQEFGAFFLQHGICGV